ncbi:L,D-transpeptidase catalytic domain containing protein [Candidatus Pelagibacterales bacterium]
MIIINNYGYLTYKKLKFRCSLGKAGIGDKIREGDNITPNGIFKIIKVYYRNDRIKNIKSNFNLIKINKTMGWCNDYKSRYYNRQIKLPSKFSHEKLFRKDNLYDLICVLNFNNNPTIKKKGSAIFIHISRKKYKATSGCIGLTKNNLIKLLRILKKDTKIKIIKN